MIPPLCISYELKICNALIFRDSIGSFSHQLNAFMLFEHHSMDLPGFANQVEIFLLKQITKKEKNRVLDLVSY